MNGQVNGSLFGGSATMEIETRQSSLAICIMVALAFQQVGFLE